MALNKYAIRCYSSQLGKHKVLYLLHIQSFMGMFWP